MDENLEEKILRDPEQNAAAEISFPEQTTWEVVCNCCFRPFVRVQTDPPRFFWGHTELDSWMPVIVTALILYPFLIYVFVILPAYDSQKLQIIALVEVSIALVLFLWSYMYAAFSDPGYLPFDWIRDKKMKYSWQEQMTGLGVRQDQIDFAKSHRPSFASFSKSAGRFVIRADHICGWIANWVGKRNHKQFILMTFWGSFYCLSLFIWDMFGVTSIAKSMLKMVVVMSVFGLECMFGMMMMFAFVSTMKDLRQNVTKIQKWKNERNMDANEYSFEEAMREVFGKGSFWCWCVPVPAFGEDLGIVEGELPDEVGYIDF